VLASNQVDISVTPLAETPDRLRSSIRIIPHQRVACSASRLIQVRAGESPSTISIGPSTIAYYTGGGEETWVKERFPKAQLRGVAGSGWRLWKK